jgi:CRP-like cAMP-binding protein
VNDMPASPYSFLAVHPTESVPPGTTLLRRCVPAPEVLFIEAGRVAIGIAASAAARAAGSAMDHQLGMVEGPAWLEAQAAVLNLPCTVDAITETPVQLRRVPLQEFRAAVSDGPVATQAVLSDLARAHRQQIELAVSRLSKDAEARCAEWLLRHAENNDKGVCSVKLLQRKRLIAAQLGIAPETLSRVLRHMRERSLISGSGRVVQLMDTAALRSLAGI